MDGGAGRGPGGEERLAAVGRRVGDAVVVAVCGELDMLTAPQLLPAIEQCVAAAECRVLVVDLGAVSFLESTGLNALLSIHEFAEERGLPLRLVATENRHVMRPLEITGLDKTLTIYPSVDEALQEPGAAGDVD